MILSGAIGIEAENVGKLAEISLVEVIQPRSAAIVERSRTRRISPVLSIVLAIPSSGNAFIPSAYNRIYLTVILYVFVSELAFRPTSRTRVPDRCVCERQLRVLIFKLFPRCN